MPGPNVHRVWFRFSPFRSSQSVPVQLPLFPMVPPREPVFFFLPVATGKLRLDMIRPTAWFPGHMGKNPPFDSEVL